MPPLPADSIHARACKLKCEKILTRPSYLRQLIEQMIDGGGQNGRTQFQLIWKIIQIISYD